MLSISRLSAHTAPYRYALLDPATDPSEPVPDMLGIEVTDDRLAGLCGLGNVDPQHDPAAATGAQAAIEACLDLPPPAEGSQLVTIRPDLDSLGAMALLTLRAERASVTEEVRRRVAQVAAVDRFDRGPWPGPKPMPRALADFSDDWPGEDMASLAACLGDRTLTIETRVAAARDWISSGRAPESHRGALVARNAALLQSLQHQTTRITQAHSGRVAVVVSIHAGALALGYRSARIVVAFNPAFRFPDGVTGRKFTLVRWAEGDGDLNRVVKRLSRIEKGWGGQRGIKGSPQDHPSILELAQVVRAMRAALD